MSRGTGGLWLSSGVPDEPFDRISVAAAPFSGTRDS
jgi:hypothetical protein